MTKEEKDKRQRKKKREDINRLCELARYDWLCKDNHLSGKFAPGKNLVGWSIESLLHCPDIPYTSEAKELLYDLSRREINGKKIPDWYDIRTFKYDVNYKNSCIDKYYDINYIYEIRWTGGRDRIKRRKYPCIMVQTSLYNFNYVTNFPKYDYKENYNSSASKELQNFVRNYTSFENRTEHVKMKVAFWNKRWSIIKFEFPSDRWIICYAGEFARMNDASNKNNKFYYPDSNFWT